MFDFEFGELIEKEIGTGFQEDKGWIQRTFQQEKPSEWSEWVVFKGPRGKMYVRGLKYTRDHYAVFQSYFIEPLEKY